MLDLLLEPTTVFVRNGIKAFRASKEHQNLSIAVQDRIRREVRFNAALLQEIMKFSENGNSVKKDEHICLTLIKALQTEAFDEINKGVLPLSLFFENQLAKEEIFPNWFEKNKFFDWMKKIYTQYDLLERVYHRIKLAKTFAEAGRLQGNMKYIQFMLIGFEKSIANTDLQDQS